MDEFEAFVVARFGALVRTAYLLVGDWGLAQDLVQDALASTASRWADVCRRGDPEPYVRQVMYHRAIDWWRRRRVPEFHYEAPPEPAPRGDDAEETTARRLMLTAALGRLTSRQRAVLVLRFYEDRTEVETAAVLGCSVNTVKSQCRHALNRLRDLSPDILIEFQPKGVSTT